MELNERLYSQAEIQDMIDRVNRDPKLEKKILTSIKDRYDLASLKTVLQSGSVETFQQFDSEVSELFIRTFLKATNESNSSAVKAILNGTPVREAVLLFNEDDAEYWNYVHMYGDEEEREKAAEYFDVTPSAFDETYAQFRDESLDEAKTKDLSGIETDDYQNRGGNYPASGVPDTIQVYGKDNKMASFSFKNTSEDRAESWVTRYLKKLGFEIKSISTNQDGDYQDDWVVCSVTVK